MKRLAYGVFFAAVAACGGGGTSVSIVGDPPEDQAATLADAYCDQQSSCGEASVDCAIDPDTEMLDCVGTIEDVEFDACLAEAEPDFLAAIESCQLTAEEEQAAEDCANALLAQSCISQSELDEYAAEIEAGNEPPPLRDVPAECEGVEVLFGGCTPA